MCVGGGGGVYLVGSARKCSLRSIGEPEIKESLEQGLGGHIYF